MPHKNDPIKKRRFLRLPFKERENFTEDLALLLKAAIPIGEALDSLASTVKTSAFKKALSIMKQDVDAGYGLADSLERSGISGEQTVALVRLGEESGNLVENLLIAAEQEEKHHAMIAKVRSAFIYPAVVIFLTITIGLGVAWFLLPKLAVTFAQLKVTLPLVSRIFIGFGQFLSDHGIVAVPLFVAAVIIIIYVLFIAPKTKSIGRRLLLRTPGVGRLIREVEIAQFGYLLGTLMNAGLSVTYALRLLAQTSTAPDYRELYKYLADAIDKGMSFKESFEMNKKGAGLLTPSIRQMMIAGERSGSLPEVLTTVGRTYEQKSDLTTQNLETIIEPILLVIVAGGVMLVAISVILPIYSLVGGLNQ